VISAASAKLNAVVAKDAADAVPVKFPTNPPEAVTIPEVAVIIPDVKLISPATVSCAVATVVPIPTRSLTISTNILLSDKYIIIRY
jgi:hypothetical protein